MTWRRWVILGITVFLVLVVVFSLIPYTWQGSLEVPAGEKGRSGSVQCPALWSPDSAHWSLPYPPASKPCSSRTDDRVMTAVDVLLGLAGLLVVARSGRRSSSTEDDEPVGPVPA